MQMGAPHRYFRSTMLPQHLTETLAILSVGAAIDDTECMRLPWRHIQKVEKKDDCICTAAVVAIYIIYHESL